MSKRTVNNRQETLRAMSALYPERRVVFSFAAEALGHPEPPRAVADGSKLIYRSRKATARRRSSNRSPWRSLLAWFHIS